MPGGGVLPLSEHLTQGFIAPLRIEPARLNAAMPEVPGDVLKVLSLLHQRCADVVPQRVHALVGHAGVLADLLEPGAGP